jgi:hypothetical protein
LFDDAGHHELASSQILKARTVKAPRTFFMVGLQRAFHFRQLQLEFDR